MRRGERARRHVRGLAVAGLLHAVVLTALAIGARGPPPLPEPPIVQVLLTPPPKSRAPPKPVEPHRPVTDRKMKVAAPIPPVVLPAVTEDQRQTLMAAPFDESRPVYEALRRRCQEYVRIEDLEREHCPTAGPIKPLNPGQIHANDPTGGFAQAARRKDAIRTYKNTTSDETFPGLRCSFGRAC